MGLRKKTEHPRGFTIKTVKKGLMPDINYVLAPDGTLLAIVKDDDGMTLVIDAEDFDTMFLAGPRQAASAILMPDIDVNLWLEKNFPTTGANSGNI